MSGEAMAMRIELARLGVRHGVAHRPHIIPLADPIDGPVTVEGFASISDIDLEFTRFRPFAFCNPCLFLTNYARPPLYFRHDETQIAGAIESLSYDDRGNLRIRAHVTHEQAKRCGAFSIRAKINAYELRDVDTKSFHALVTSGEIIEVSLTDRPGNPNAIVRSRYPAPPVDDYLRTLGERAELSTKAVDIIRRQVELIQRLAQAPTPVTRPRPPVRRTSIAPPPPRRPTQFAALAAALNERTAS